MTPWLDKHWNPTKPSEVEQGSTVVQLISQVEQEQAPELQYREVSLFGKSEPKRKQGEAVKLPQALRRKKRVSFCDRVSLDYEPQLLKLGGRMERISRLKQHKR